MEITWIGLIAIPLTFFLFFRYRLSTVLKLTIFFLPFGAVSVANFYNIPPFFGIGLDRYFAVILILSVILFSFNRVGLPNVLNKIKWLFFLSLLAIGISWIAPLYFDKIMIWEYFTEPFSSFHEVPLTFTVTNVTKAAEFLISGLFFTCVYKTLPLISPNKIARITILSLFIMNLSSFLDFFPEISRIWEVLKNNISYSNAQGVIYGYFEEPRLSGLAVEPSHLVIYSLKGLAIVCAFLKNNVTLFEKRVDFVLLTVFIIASICTFSPTILVGYTLIVGYLIYQRNTKKILKVCLWIVIPCVIVFVVSNQLNTDLFGTLIKTAIGKLGISAEYGIHSEYRLISVLAVWNAFLQSPAIGVGWGSVVHQVGFPLLLLGSVGILGTSVFLYLIASIFRLALKKIIYSSDISEKALREGFILCFLILTFMCFYTKAFLYFFNLSVIYVAAGMCSNYKISNRNEPT